MRSRAIYSILTLLAAGLMMLIFSFVYRQHISNKFEMANQYYARHDYMKSAEIYWNIINSAFKADVHEKALFQLTTILYIRANSDELKAFFANNEGIEPYFLEIFKRWRDQEQGAKQAGEALEYLTFLDNGVNQASRRFITYLQERLSMPVGEVSHGRAWTLRIKGIRSITSDRQGNIWALLIEPDRLVRFDVFGNIVEEIFITLPDEVTHRRTANINFDVAHNGDFIIAVTRFNRQGRQIKHLLLDTLPKDVIYSDQKEWLLLIDDGIQAYDSRLNQVWQVIGHGSRAESFTIPVALDANNDSIVVLSWDRLQLFDLQGQFKMIEEGKFSWAWDVALDSQGLVYLGSVNGKKIDIHNRQLKKVTSLAVESDQLAVGQQDIIYAMGSDQLSAYYPRQDKIDLLLSSHQQINYDPEHAKPEKSVVEFTVNKVDSYPHITVHNSTRWILDIANAQTQPSILWLATIGGLLRYDTAQQDWRKWSVAQGIPNAKIERIINDGTYLWIRSENEFIRLNLQTKLIEKIELASNKSFGLRDIIQDKANPDRLWLLESRMLIRYSKLTNRGEKIADIQSAISFQQTDAGRLIILDGHKRILQVDPETKQITTLLTVEDINDQIKRPASVKRDTWLGDIEFDSQRRGIWLGLYYDYDIYFYDLHTHTFEQVLIDAAVLRHCNKGGAAVEVIGQERFFIGQQCMAKLLKDGRSWRLLINDPRFVRGTLLKGHDSNTLWFASYSGLIEIDQENNYAIRLHDSPWSEPSSFQNSSLHRVGSKLWVANGSSFISIFDLQKRTWEKLQGVIANKLRAYGDDIIATSYRFPYKINTQDFSYQKLHLGNKPWQSLNDLVYDGETWWAVGGLSGRDEAGLKAWNGRQEQRWTRAQGMPFGVGTQLILDPYSSNILWIASDEGLIRFDKLAQTAEVVKQGYISQMETDGRRIFAILGKKLFIWDCETGEYAQGSIADKDNLGQLPELIKWKLYDTKALLKYNPRFIYDVERIRDKDEQTLWMSTHDGILEIALPNDFQ